MGFLANKDKKHYFCNRVNVHSLTDFHDIDMGSPLNGRRDR